MLLSYELIEWKKKQPIASTFIVFLCVTVDLWLLCNIWNLIPNLIYLTAAEPWPESATLYQPLKGQWINRLSVIERALAIILV